MSYASFEMGRLRDENGYLLAENGLLRHCASEAGKERDRLRSEHATMLATLTATQKRCTEQEQRIRDQERELVELRGKQGAEIEGYPFGPAVSGWLEDVTQHDTLEKAIAAAKELAHRRPQCGKAFAAQAAFARRVFPAQAERIEDDDYTSPF